MQDSLEGCLRSSRHRVHTLGSYTSQPRLYTELSERERTTGRRLIQTTQSGLRRRYAQPIRQMAKTAARCSVSVYACGRYFHGKRNGSWISREAPRGISQRKSEPRTTRRPRAHGARKSKMAGTVGRWRASTIQPRPPPPSPIQFSAPHFIFLSVAGGLSPHMLIPFRGEPIRLCSLGRSAFLVNVRSSSLAARLVRQPARQSPERV